MPINEKAKNSVWQILQKSYTSTRIFNLLWIIGVTWIICAAHWHRSGIFECVPLREWDEIRWWNDGLLMPKHIVEMMSAFKNGNSEEDLMTDVNWFLVLWS